jgi:hypothetical protein
MPCSRFPLSSAVPRVPYPPSPLARAGNLNRVTFDACGKAGRLDVGGDRGGVGLVRNGTDVLAMPAAVGGLSLGDEDIGAWAANPASRSQIGNRRAGFRQRNCVSRFKTILSSIQARILGPVLLASGSGSIIVRCRMPPGARIRWISRRSVGRGGWPQVGAS